MVSVLTMPSAATMTATRASASNRPKTRSRASPMAPWIRSSVDRFEGEGASLVGEAGRGRPPWPSAAKRTAKASAPATPRRAGVGPADEDGLAGAAGQRPFGDADDRQGDARPVGGGGIDAVADREAVARRDAGRQDRGAAGVERGEGRGAIAGDEAQAAVGGEVGADHRGAVDAHAVDGQVEGRDRADRGHAGQVAERLVEALVRRRAGRSR